MVNCPQCGTQFVARARRRALREFLLALVTVYPFRCQLCRHRFFALRGRPTHSPRREYRRVLVRYPVSLSPVLRREQRGHGEGTMLNLSIQGCGLESGVSVARGALLHLSVEVSEGQPPVEVDSAIVRNHVGTRMGLEFLTIQPEQDAHFRRLMEAKLSAHLPVEVLVQT